MPDLAPRAGNHRTDLDVYNVIAWQRYVEMTSSVETTHYRSSHAFGIVLVIIGFMLMMVIGVSLAIAPALAFRPASPPQPARPVSWAAADIAKPTYTPSPVPTATPIPPPVIETALPTAEVALPAPDVSPVSPAGKYILVSISDQHLSAYEGNQLVYSFVASTGMGNSTRTGQFTVLDKIPDAYGATWNIWMPNWLGIYYSGSLENGIHALPILPDGNRLWSGYLGTPISFGCVVLGSDAALDLYNWADVGTPVEIRW
jgi:lipoprotein-anchoring transpeptidase ErfK/SrfK